MASGRRALDSESESSDSESIEPVKEELSDLTDTSSTPATTGTRRNLRASTRLSSRGQNFKFESDAELEETGAAKSPGFDSVKRYPVRLSLRKRARAEEDDEYNESAYESETGSQSNDDYSELSDGGFVVDSDDKPISRATRSGRKRTRLTHRRRDQPRSSRRLTRARRRTSSASSSDVDLAELRKEVRDLHSPSPQRVERALRAREPINYEIRPPPSLEEIEKVQAMGSMMRNGCKQKGPPRSLYPVHGPFGGKDVKTLYKHSREELQAIILDTSKASSTANGTSEALNIIGASSVADTDPLAIETNINFDSVGGLDEYIEKLKEMVSLPLLYPDIYKQFGVTPPRGVLFHGPPGTGKTLMARALASSCTLEGKKVTFFMRKGADCLSKWIGEAERQLRALFDEAKAKQPSIIFFDEIDGLAPVRSSKQEQIHASIVSTLLALMDGMDNRGQVVVIGATNRPDSVDPALRRPGRFDREFYFPLPNSDARARIIQIHTRKWSPPLQPYFINHISNRTKGYGGADLRALCTEAALNAIQRTYPQIYMSSEKLQVDPSSIQVLPRDFMKSMDKIVPSSQRSASSAVMPLPSRIEPLLGDFVRQVVSSIRVMLPVSKSLTSLQEAMYEIDEADFETQENLRDFQSARIHRPRLLLHGTAGQGQEYLGPALANACEGVYCQFLDLSLLYGDSMRTPEAELVQILSEAKKRTPSMLVIPNIDVWFEISSAQMRALFFNLFGSLLPTDKILVLGVSSQEAGQLDSRLLDFFGHNTRAISVNSSQSALRLFFDIVYKYILMSPERTRSLEDRPKRKLPVLPVSLETSTDISTTPIDELEKARNQERTDLKTRNQLKVKLGGLMEAFKKRYKRFCKPVIEEDNLIHLFEPLGPEYVPLYELTDHNMIREIATGKLFHNMDLDVMEDRLWNGYYIEPKQLLQDVELIHADSLTLGNRDRIHKSSEMLANAQVAIDEINDPSFLHACKDLRLRTAEKELAELNSATISEPAEREAYADVSSEQAPSNSNFDDLPRLDKQSETISEPPVQTTCMEVSPELPPQPASNKQALPLTDLLDSNPGVLERPRFEVNLARADALMAKLAERSVGQSVDVLERRLASAVDVVCVRQGDWNRDSMLDDLEHLVDSYL